MSKNIPQRIRVHILVYIHICIHIYMIDELKFAIFVEPDLHLPVLLSRSFSLSIFLTPWRTFPELLNRKLQDKRFLKSGSLSSNGSWQISIRTALTNDCKAGCNLFLPESHVLPSIKQYTVQLSLARAFKVLLVWIGTRGRSRHFRSKPDRDCGCVLFQKQEFSVHYATRRH